MRRIFLKPPLLFLGLVAFSGWARAGSISGDDVTLRMVESGEFRHSLLQGAEMDLVNETDKPVLCDVRMVLRRADADTVDFREIQRAEQQQVEIPGHARRGFRVAEPRTYGRCRVEYEVKAGGAVRAASHFDFDASGPYQLQVQPYFLGHDGMHVKVEMLDPNAKVERVRFKVLNATRKKVLFQTGEFRRFPDKKPYPTVESFVSFARQRPGSYIVEVDVLENNSGKQAAAVRLASSVIPLALPTAVSER